MGIFASDMECTGLLDMMMEQESPKLHNFCSLSIDSDEVRLFEGGKDKKKLQAWFDEGHTFIMHNGYTFDMPALELLGYDISKTKFIDSLALSWYLEPNRIKHGLAEYGVEFGVPKPVIEDWESQTQEEYNHRVIEDCKIQKHLWLKQVGQLQELYGKEEGSFDRLVSLLMQKMSELQQQQENRWPLDELAAEELKKQLEDEVSAKIDLLKEAMPKVPQYILRNPPSKGFKKSGELSATGERWKELTESLGLPFEHKEPIKVVVKMEEGNPSSHKQIKDWLYSLGWEPMTFKFIREDDGTTRQIPQVNLAGGEVCDSVKELIPKCAGIDHIAGLGILNHRKSVVNGFIRDAFRGCLVAGAQGFTNTLRLKHHTIVNLPSLRVKYGKELRGCLTAKEGYVLLGSDLSSLEDMLKHHFQWKLDPEYVKSQMSSGFDPHMAIATMAGLVSQEDADWYSIYKKADKSVHNKSDDLKFKGLDSIRAAGKSTNYACLPMHTKVLTKNGWKLYDQISVGDVLQTFNSETGFVEDDMVLHKQFFKDKELFAYSNTADTFKCTEDHRWYGWKRRRVGKVNSTSYREYGFTKISDMKQENNILLTAPYKTDSFSNVSVEEARFFGWLLSDGCYRWSDRAEKTSSSFGKRRKVRASISQSDSKYCKELEDCLHSIGVLYRKDRKEVKNGNTVNNYTIKSAWMRTFLDKHFKDRENKHDVDWSKWVCNLSIPALEAFYESFYLGDGLMLGRERQEIIAQNSGNIQDCIIAVAQLLGRGRVTINRKANSACSGIRTQRRKHITMQEMQVESLGVQDTFCLTTNNSTFIIWQDDFIGITGNCQYGAGVKTVSRTAKVSEKVGKKLHEGYHKLNWSIAKIAQMMVTKKALGGVWQKNPVNGYWYSLRSDKDKFSTLIQGLGSYILDLWLLQIENLAKKRGLEYNLLGQFHDELIISCKEGMQDEYRKLVSDGLSKVNSIVKLHRELACEINFGYKYSDIH